MPRIAVATPVEMIPVVYSNVAQSSADLATAEFALAVLMLDGVINVEPRPFVAPGSFHQRIAHGTQSAQFPHIECPLIHTSSPMLPEHRAPKTRLSYHKAPTAVNYG